MKIRYWKVGAMAALGCVLLLVLVVGLYVNRIGLDNIGLMLRLHASGSEGAILRMSVYGDYVSKASPAQETLKARMLSEGWTFVDQQGSGYFFEKDNQKTIVTATQIWGGDYIRYRVADRAVDLAS